MIHPVNQNPSVRLALGTFLGRHGIRQYVGRDPFLGDRYAVLFGTTNRVYDINVASGEPEAATLQDYAAVVETTAALRHPCLFPYFACGEDDGLVWIRSEHTDGVPDWVTHSVEPKVSGASDDETDVEICFPTLQSLLEATGGRLAAKDRNLIIGDLAEVLAFLHAHGSFAGAITPETVFLDHTYRHATLIARLRYYAFPASAATDATSRNLRQCGELIQTLLAATSPARPGKLDQALTTIASHLVADGTYADGVALYDAICHAFENANVPRSDRFTKQKPHPAAEAKAPSQSSSEPDANIAVERRRSSRHRHHRRHHLRAFNSSSSTGQIVAMVLRIALMFAGIVGVGVGVFLGMKYLEDRERSHMRITSAERYSAITIIEDTPPEVALQGFPERIEDYSREQLQTAADLGEPVAAARLAILTLLDDPRNPAMRNRADRILELRLTALEHLAKTDPVATYWLGYAWMVGLGGAPDATQAVATLERAIAKGHADAGILLGDWHAARSPTPNPEDDRRAMYCWRAAFGNPAKWTTTQIDAIDRIIRFVREGRGFKNDDADLARLLQRAAAAGHAESILLVSELHEQGLLVEPNDAIALSWLRRLGSNDTIAPALRAEVQRRMADKFAAGRGTPASASAARIWYERAAKLGNVKAMLAPADLCDSGIGAEDGRKTPDEARYWRDKAAATKPLAPPAFAWRFTRDMLPPSAAAPAD